MNGRGCTKGGGSVRCEVIKQRRVLIARDETARKPCPNIGAKNAKKNEAHKTTR